MYDHNYREEAASAAPPSGGKGSSSPGRQAALLPQEANAISKKDSD